MKNKQRGEINGFMVVVIIIGMVYGISQLKSNNIGSDSIRKAGSFFSIKVNNDDGYKGYGLQLMATKQLAAAKSLMNDFAKDGYSAFVVATPTKGRTLYKVRLGPYSHKPEALAIKDKVVRRYPNNPYVKSSLVIYKPN